jgi:DNA-directed RNA polymerase subunit RPC12/RpoP
MEFIHLHKKGAKIGKRIAYVFFNNYVYFTNLFVFFQKNLIPQKQYLMYMTMACLRCGKLMVWLNGSISHTHDTNYYECRNCKIKVIKYSDDNVTEIEEN